VTSVASLQPRVAMAAGLAFYLAIALNVAVISSLAVAPWRVPPQLRRNAAARTSKQFGEELWYEQQLLDHFAPGDFSVWRQRYFVNDSFWRNARTGPVFLCVGGEGPGFEPSVVVGDVHCSDMIAFAELRGALILALEHRFYGLSVPTPDFSTSSLRLLSSFQALSDTARFHAFITERYSLLPNTPWITWGGSYPGMMAGWARVRYPHLFLGAVASSAPVEAVLNYRGYLDVVREAYENDDPLIGGGGGCAEAIEAAFSAVGTALASPEGRRSLEARFPVCGTELPLDDTFVRASLANSLADNFFPAQTNDPFCTAPGCNIARVCAIMRDTAKGAPVDRLAALVGAVLPVGRCITETKAAHDKRLTDTSIAGGQDRVWFWQTCTAYGFYQTCDPDSACMFTRDPHVTSLEDSLQDCVLAFGDAGSRADAAVAYTNVQWGALSPSARNLLFVNGEVDPWNAASVQVSPGPGISVLWVPGASHHAWTHPPAANDPPAIVLVRQQINDIVGSWLDAPLQNVKGGGAAMAV